MALRWFIITGEYPPQPGGVSDYTRVIATALAASGDEVGIWTGPLPPSIPQEQKPVDGVGVHRTSDHFGRKALSEMDAALNRVSAGTRVLVQYEPWSFGYRGLNVRFAWWLRECKRRHPGLPLAVMFHEVATEWGREYSLKQSVHGLITHGMASLSARAANRIFMSVPVWGPTLRSLIRKDQSPVWLPVPSNVPRMADASRIKARREHILASTSRSLDDGLIVGHFSTYRGQIPKMLQAMIPRLLAEKSCAALVLLGRGGADFAEAVLKENPAFASRLVVAGEMALDSVAEWLAACDLLVQPYPDGVSSRRTTVMAGLNLGCPIVTNSGHCSDPNLWAESRAVRLVDSIDPGLIGAATVDLMNNPVQRVALSERARQFYGERFSVERTVEALRAGE